MATSRLHRTSFRIGCLEMLMRMTRGIACWTLLALATVSRSLPALAQNSTPSVPSQPPPSPAPTENPGNNPLADGTSRLAEVQAQLAWLADPITCPHPLTAHASGGAMVVGGMVPNPEVYRRALELARVQAGLSLRDTIEVRAAPAQLLQRRTVQAMEQEASAALRELFPNRAPTFVIKAHVDGQVTVSGTIASYEEKLAVSLRIREVPGCACVVNQLAVLPVNVAGKAYLRVSADGRELVSSDAGQPANATGVVPSNAGVGTDRRPVVILGQPRIEGIGLPAPVMRTGFTEPKPEAVPPTSCTGVTLHSPIAIDVLARPVRPEPAGVAKPWPMGLPASERPAVARTIGPPVVGPSQSAKAIVRHEPTRTRERKWQPVAEPYAILVPVPVSVSRTEANPAAVGSASALRTTGATGPELRVPAHPAGTPTPNPMPPIDEGARPADPRPFPAIPGVEPLQNSEIQSAELLPPPTPSSTADDRAAEPARELSSAVPFVRIPRVLSPVEVVLTAEVLPRTGDGPVLSSAVPGPKRPVSVAEHAVAAHTTGNLVAYAASTAREDNRTILYGPQVRQYTPQCALCTTRAPHWQPAIPAGQQPLAHMPPAAAVPAAPALTGQTGPSSEPRRTDVVTALARSSVPAHPEPSPPTPVARVEATPAQQGTHQLTRPGTAPAAAHPPARWYGYGVAKPKPLLPPVVPAVQNTPAPPAATPPATPVAAAKAPQPLHPSVTVSSTEPVLPAEPPMLPIEITERK